MRYYSLQAYYFFFFVMNGFSVFLPKYYGEIGLSDGMIGVLGSVPTVVAMAFAPMLALLTDRVPKKRYMLCALMILLAAFYFLAARCTTIVPLLLVVGVNFSLIMQGDVPKALCFVLLPAMVLILGWIHLWFGYLSRFGDTTKVILSNTFRMTVGSFLWVLALLVLLAATVALAMEILMIAAPLLLIVPGLYAMFADKLLEKAFKKYLPQVKDGTEDSEQLTVES